jgi:hypothetical protein
MNMWTFYNCESVGNCIAIKKEMAKPNFLANGHIFVWRLSHGKL